MLATEHFGFEWATVEIGEKLSRMQSNNEGLQLFGFLEEGKGVGSDHWGFVHFDGDEEPTSTRPQDESLSFLPPSQSSQKP
jgi:hypothetical protein